MTTFFSPLQQSIERRRRAGEQQQQAGAQASQGLLGAVDKLEMYRQQFLKEDQARAASRLAAEKLTAEKEEAKAKAEAAGAGILLDRNKDTREGAKADREAKEAARKQAGESLVNAVRASRATGLKGPELYSRVYESTPGVKEAGFTDQDIEALYIQQGGELSAKEKADIDAKQRAADRFARIEAARIAAAAGADKRELTSLQLDAARKEATLGKPLDSSVAQKIAEFDTNLQTLKDAKASFQSAGGAGIGRLSSRAQSMLREVGWDDERATQARADMVAAVQPIIGELLGSARSEAEMLSIEASIPDEHQPEAVFWPALESVIKRAERHRGNMVSSQGKAGRDVSKFQETSAEVKTPFDD